MAARKSNSPIYERRLIMSSRYELGFFMAAVISVIFVTILVTALPVTDRFDGKAGVATSHQPVSINQHTDPMLLVPESTMGEKPQQYLHNWDDNPVATIPESTMGSKLERYAHDWDDNPVAYIPEATLIGHPRRYIHNWDDNPVAYIPESTMGD
jgi:hypothetical protein